MKLALDPRVARILRRVPVSSPAALASAALIMLIAVQLARLLWMLVMPLGPVGDWKVRTGLPPADLALLTRFDPFGRLAAAPGPVAVSSLPLKLFGIRMDQAAGRGSAIIQGADGLQNSYAIGDAIMPGVLLKSVAFDSVTVDRGGGTFEQIFLDQSVPSKLVSGSAPTPGGVVQPAAGPPPPIVFSERRVNGQISGFRVNPGGSGTAFAAAGLQPGDVVTAINGNVPRSPAEALAAAQERPISGIITYTVERNGKTLTFNTEVPSQ